MTPEPRSYRRALPPLDRRGRRSAGPEQGFALLAVMLVLSILLTVSLVAFSESGVDLTGTQRADVALAADTTSGAGVADALYDIADGNFVCALTKASLLSSPANAAGAPSASYSVTVAYFGADWTPGTTPGPSMPCPTQGSVPAAALITSTGSSALGSLHSQETISEQIAISVAPQGFVAYSAGPAGLDLTNLQVVKPGGPAGPVGGQGVIYSKGPVSDSGSSCAPQSPWATVVTEAGANLHNCNVGGSLSVGGGNLVLSATPVGGYVTVGGGDAVLGASTVAGNVVASGNVHLCGNNPTPSWCSGLSGATSTIYGSVTAASGGVTIDSTPVASGAGTPCPATSVDGVTIDGCVTDASGNRVSPPEPVSLPDLGSPDINAWAAAGYSVDENAACSGGTNTAGSVPYDLAHLSANTLIVADCPSTGVNLSNLGTIKLGSTGRPGTSYNAAVFVTGGITVDGNTSFAPAGSSAAQLSLIVPQPTSFTSSSCDSTYNVVDSAGSLTSGSAAVFVYTPCVFTDGAPAKLTGEIVAGQIQLSKPLSMTYASFTPPGLIFAYLTRVEQRRITGL